MARILLPACHRMKVFHMWLFQIIPGISCTNNEVENKFFPRSSRYFFFDSHHHLHQLFQTPVGRQTWNRIWNWNPNIWLNKMVTSWTIFHKGVRENSFPTFTYHIHHYGNVLCGFSNLRVWGKKKIFLFRSTVHCSHTPPNEQFDE